MEEYFEKLCKIGKGLNNKTTQLGRFLVGDVELFSPEHDDLDSVILSLAFENEAALTLDSLFDYYNDEITFTEMYMQAKDIYIEIFDGS